MARMIRSRVTLASTEAAATDAQRASPPMTVSTGGAHTAPSGGAGAVAPGVGLDRAVGVEELRHRRRAHEVEGAVEDHGVGDEIGRQLPEGPPRGQAERGGHAQSVALLGPGVADGPTGAPRRHPVEHGLPRVLGELLGVTQALRDPSRRLAQHRHPHAERPGPRTPTHLVDPRHHSVAGAPQAALVHQPRSGRNGPAPRLRTHRRPGWARGVITPSRRVRPHWPLVVH